MKSRNVASPHAIKGIRGLVGLGLLAFAAMPVSPAFAEKDSQPVAAPAPAVPPAPAPAPAPASVAPVAKPAPTPVPAPAAAPAKPAPAKSVVPAKSVGASLPVECVRTGQHVIAALARDDSGTASQFHNFYVAFKCPPQQLAQAFGCLVKLQTANPGLTNPSPEQVRECWEDPSTLPKVLPPPPPAQ